MPHLTTVPVQALPPAGPPIPLVCDSPHSGTDYPPDYGFAVAIEELRRLEDTHVQWLWDSVPRVGGTLVHALFPRSYIDPNRDERDIEPELLSEPWPDELRPTARTLALGNGLISRLTPGREAIYARRLSVREVAHRIERCWQPYRQAVAQALARASLASPGGGYWHLNLHSLPGNVYERLGRAAPGPLADIVLGDLHGASCGAALTDAVTQAFRRRGYTVALNEPYAGQDLLRAFGDPARGRHSLQIELNRAIYLDERTRERLPRAHAVRDDIAAALQEIASHIRAACAATP